VSLLLVAACLPISWLRLYALGGFLILIVHVITAAACGSDFWGSMRILMTIPFYIFWKLRMIPEIWHNSRATSAWVRTERISPVDGQ